MPNLQLRHFLQHKLVQDQLEVVEVVEVVVEVVLWVV
jgi:hypothetical protein